MKVSLVQAKNGETSATYNNLYLHSSYNPTKEAERFVQSINIDYDPAFIIITEPGLGYAITQLRKRFPNAKIIIIRYCEEFNSYNKQGDYSINYYDNKINLINSITTIINEVDLLNSLFIQWPPSSKIFGDLEKQLTSEIKECFTQAKTLLITREYFERKWLMNTISFLKYSNKLIKLTKPINKDVIIISSGPSLKDVIPIIKHNRNNFFIIALSSAIKVTLTNSIIPDLAISTDGGYWAGQHLKSLYKYNIPLAMPVEAYIQRSLLNKIKILPLNYGDGISSDLLSHCDLDYGIAIRNGTVSGTALEFALQYCTKNIFFTGLDMSNQKGLQHCQPNELELNNSIHDFKLSNKEKRAVCGEFSKGVLDIYKEWFNNFKLNGRKVYRIINNNYKKNTLGEIKDISTSQFQNLIIKTTKHDNIYTESLNKVNLLDLENYIEKKSKTDEWKYQLFPLSLSSIMHNKNNIEIQERMENENNIIINKIRKLINE